MSGPTHGLGRSAQVRCVSVEAGHTLLGLRRGGGGPSAGLCMATSAFLTNVLCELEGVNQEV